MQAGAYRALVLGHARQIMAALRKNAALYTQCCTFETKKRLHIASQRPEGLAATT
jgi:hypothetical protein